MSVKTSSFKNKLKSNWIFSIAFLILALYSLFLLLMLVWVLMTSIKDPSMDWGGLGNNKWGLPAKVYMENYLTLIRGYAGPDDMVGTGYDLGFTYFNSFLYAIGCGLFSTAVPCITAYVVARFGKKYRFLNIYTQIVIICMIIPIVGSTPSELNIARKLGIYGHIWGIWLMKGYFLGTYFLIFLATYKGMPDGYAEAAKIDGAGNFTVFFRIYFPLTVKIFATILLIKSIEYWNDYQTPLYYLEDKTKHTLALFQYNLMAGNQTDTMGNTPIRMTMTMFLVLPLLIIFIFLNKYIMGNLSLGGLKE